MQSRMSAAISSALGTLQGVAGVPAVIRRGELECAATVIPAASSCDVQNVDGLFERIENRDMLIRSSDYKPGDAYTRPIAGDEIIAEVGDETFVYEVAPFAGTECWRESDRYGNMLRVHVRLVGRINTLDENFQRSLSGVVPQGDGQTDAADRRHASGNVRVFE